MQSEYICYKYNSIAGTTYNSNTASNTDDGNHHRLPFSFDLRHVGLEEEVWHDEPNGENQRRYVVHKEVKLGEHLYVERGLCVLPHSVVPFLRI